MIETDEFVSNNSEGFLMDSITISTAYLKMKNLCMSIGKEIQADIKIHNQHIFPRYVLRKCYKKKMTKIFIFNFSDLHNDLILINNSSL